MVQQNVPIRLEHGMGCFEEIAIIRFMAGLHAAVATTALCVKDVRIVKQNVSKSLPQRHTCLAFRLGAAGLFIEDAENIGHVWG